jgi:hypothetical protein
MPVPQWSFEGMGTLFQLLRTAFPSVPLLICTVGRAHAETQATSVVTAAFPLFLFYEMTYNPLKPCVAYMAAVHAVPVKKSLCSRPCAWWDIIAVIENIRGGAKHRVIKTAWDVRIGAYNLSAVHMCGADLHG